MVSHTGLWLWEVVCAFFVTFSLSWSLSWTAYIVFLESSRFACYLRLAAWLASFSWEHILEVKIAHSNSTQSILLLLCACLTFFAVFPKQRCVDFLKLALVNDWRYVFSWKCDDAICYANKTQLWCVNSAAFLRNFKFDWFQSIWGQT